MKENHASTQLESELDKVRMLIVLFIRHGGTGYYRELLEAFEDLAKAINSRFEQIESDIQRNADTIKDNQTRLDKLDGRDTRKVKPRSITINNIKHAGSDPFPPARDTIFTDTCWDTTYIILGNNLIDTPLTEGKTYRVTIEQLD